jgi:cytochrome c2
MHRLTALSLRRSPPPAICGLRLLSLCALVAVGTALAGCDDERSSLAAENGGDPHRGGALIRQNGCGSCHLIPGIEDATGDVGPPLTAVGRRIYLAGVVRNTPDGMVTWLRDPQAVVPGNAMPNMQLDERDARDIAAYLYTLR